MASIPEQIIARVFADPLLAGVSTAVGRRETEANAGPYRVVAIPLGAPELDEPDRHGDQRFSDKGRALLLRRFRIEWHCHDAPATEGPADFTNSEALYLNTLVAIRNVAHHAVRFGEEEWIDQQEGADDFERWGTTIKFVATFDIPVYEARSALVSLTATPQIVTTLTVENDTDPGDTVTIDQGEGS